MYDQFINVIGKPINENAEWFDFDYPDLLKILPKAKSLIQSNLNESCVDAKLLCILNNIRKTNEFTVLPHLVKSPYKTKDFFMIFGGAAAILINMVVSLIIYWNNKEK